MLKTDEKRHIMKEDFLYLRIYEELKGEITSEIFKNGDLFPPERALKERFNTTHITVRNALSRLVEEGYIERFSGRGTYVTYRKTSESTDSHRIILSTLRLNTKTIDSFTADIINRLSVQLKDFNIDIVTDLRGGTSSESISKECFHLFLFPDSGNKSLLNEDIRNSTLIIASEKIFPTVPTIICDLQAGIATATGYALELGHSSIAYIGNRTDTTDSLKKEAVLKTAHNLGLAEGSVIVVSANSTMEGAADKCAEVLSQNPETCSFICADDIIAAGVHNYLASCRSSLLPAPLVIGFGASTISSHLGFPSLDLKLDQIVEIAYQRIMEYSEKGELSPSTVEVKPDLIIRRRGN